MLYSTSPLTSLRRLVTNSGHGELGSHQSCLHSKKKLNNLGEPREGRKDQRSPVPGPVHREPQVSLLRGRGDMAALVNRNGVCVCVCVVCALCICMGCVGVSVISRCGQIPKTDAEAEAPILCHLM